MEKKIAVLPGDGIGPEVTAQAVKVLKAVGEKFHHRFTFEEGLIGAAAIDATGDPFPEKTKELCLKTDAILFGAIGHPKYDNDTTIKVRPEQGLLRMRKELGLYANIRPVMTFNALEDKSPLKPSRIRNVNFVVIRELTGGIYFGKKQRSADGTSALDECTYSVAEIERVGKVAFELAIHRSKRLTVVDKANVLETSRLWRETIKEMAKQFPEVEVEFMYVDNAAMQIILNPARFDVVLTENMFGDILTDEASVITGSLGMLPSASAGEKTSLYEPIHGSYPQATGLNIANPIGAILSAAMLLENSFGMVMESAYIYKAVEELLDNGIYTKDIDENKYVSTTEIGDRISAIIHEISFQEV